MIGQTISHYKVLEKLGEGGMGVVYKAEDSKLKRTTALKFLSPDLTRDVKAKQRFVHEAQTASALDHPNICTIYEIDETGDGQMFICMACYEGETLREKIERGPLRLKETVDIAVQVARGLAKAHERGIAHRDIKPANIFITEDAQVKIVDFGLAKLAGQARLTRTGRAMGTVAYMSPEQGRGEDVDHRTDVWSLGVVLYEMTTGQLPFRAEYEQALVYSILHEDPQPIRSLRPDLPEELDRIVTKAMAKSRGERHHDVKEMLEDLHALKRQMEFSEYSESHSWEVGRRRGGRFPAVAAVAVAAAVFLILVWQLTKEGWQSSIPQGQPLQVTSADAWEGEPALSPDGGRIAYASNRSGNLDVYIIDARGGNPLRITKDAADDYEPNWFPDGSSLAFVSDRGGQKAVWKVRQLGGGATLLLPNAEHPAISPDGEQIAFSRASPGGDLRVGVAPLADPAEVTILTEDDHGLWDHRHPAWSPDGRTICYSTQSGLWTVPSKRGDPKRLTTQGKLDLEPAWSSDGRHVYFSSFREGTLALWRVSAKGGLPERFTMGTGRESQASVSKDGSRIAYSTQAADQDLVIMDLDSGEETRLPDPRADDYMAAIAPDRSRIVFVSDRGGGQKDLWMQPLDQGTPSGPPRRMTDHGGDASHPVFSPSGEWIAYYRIIGEERDIWTIPASGGRPVKFTEHPAMDIHPAWSPDGSMLAFVSEREGGSHIWVARAKDGRRTGPPRRVTGGEISAFAPVWSPDATMIAFVGGTENRDEVWIVPSDGGAPARQVTNGACAQRVRWDSSTGTILVSGSWGEDWVTLRRVHPDDGVPEAVAPWVVFGPKTAAAMFDVSSDGHLLVFSKEHLRGNIWVLEAESGVY